MSLRATCKTQIDNEADLVEALEKIYGKRIKVVEGGIQVRGYAAAQRPSVLIDIDSMIGTAGYYKNEATGKYDLIYDNMDARRLTDVIPQKNRTTGILTDRLAQSYSQVKVSRALKNLRGGKITAESLDEEGNYKIKLKVTTY
jgi:uncharacterized protein with ACT and thioredoxin-like domain